jgi:ABC-type transporter Mla subunit MlaD
MDSTIDALTELNRGQNALRQAFVNSIQLSQQTSFKSRTAKDDLREIERLAAATEAQLQQLDQTVAKLEQKTTLNFPRFRRIVIDGVKTARESLEHTQDKLETRDKLARGNIPPEYAQNKLDNIGWEAEETRLKQMKLLWAACDYFNNPEHGLPKRRTEFQRGLCAPIK